MGGVDLKDQRKTNYQFDHRSKFKYYLRVVFDVIDIAITNSHIIYSKLSEISENTPALDSKAFRRSVARSLIGNYNCRKRSVSTSAIINQQKRSRMSLSESAVHHVMEKTDERKRCKLCTSKKHYSRTNNKCSVCNVHLFYVTSRNCFQTYHDELK